ncbi:MAG: PIN domain-containing protein [Candidatus Micrarchaeota archaeon]
MFPLGIPRKILELAVRGELIFVSTAWLLDEFKRVLSEDFLLSKEDAKNACLLFNRFFIIVEPKDIPAIAGLKNGDSNLFAAALAGNAKTIVSGDKLVQQVKIFKGIKVLSPREYWETFGVRK